MIARLAFQPSYASFGQARHLTEILCVPRADRSHNLAAIDLLALVAGSEADASFILITW